ncbi:hypothetical protein AgCh_019524 [Apium graveolens]
MAQPLDPNVYAPPPPAFNSNPSVYPPPVFYSPPVFDPNVYAQSTHQTSSGAWVKGILGTVAVLIFIVVALYGLKKWKCLQQRTNGSNASGPA